MPRVRDVRPPVPADPYAYGLTQDQRTELRLLWADGKLSIGAIARTYGLRVIEAETIIWDRTP